jgi:hypothetical protein
MRKTTAVLIAVLVLGIITSIAFAAASTYQDASFLIYRDTSDYYIQIVRPADAAVWDHAADGMSTTTAWANSYKVLTHNAYINGYMVVIPVNLPPGRYHLVLRDAAAPANTDDVVDGWEFHWSGSGLVKTPEAL